MGVSPRPRWTTPAAQAANDATASLEAAGRTLMGAGVVGWQGQAARTYADQLADLLGQVTELTATAAVLNAPVTAHTRAAEDALAQWEAAQGAAPVVQPAWWGRR